MVIELNIVLMKFYKLIYILVRFELDSDVRWIKANINQSGFYRVMYDESMWYAIIDTLKTNHTIFSPADRSSLLDDAFTLCRFVILFYFKGNLPTKFVSLNTF